MVGFMPTVSPLGFPARPAAPAAAGAPRWTTALVPAAAVLLLVALRDAGLRPLVVAGAPPALFAIAFPRLPRAAQAAGASALGGLALGAGVIAHSAPGLLAGVAALGVGLARGWGINRRHRRRRAWRNRAATTAGALLAIVFVAYPTLTAVGYLAKPRQPIRESALGLPHERVAFPAGDRVRLSGWWVPGRNGAAVVVVHGGGGDREGAVAHARMLARAGYGVLLYDARGRGRSAGHENAFGWHWDRDVRGAVDFLTRRGIEDISLLGLSTGAEAVITEAADDPRVNAVVADGVQLRIAADANALGITDRLSLQPAVGLIGAEIRAVTGERRPPALAGLVRRVASGRPLLMIATIPIERTVQRRYARGTGAQVWELPGSAHTRGLHDHPDEYARRVRDLLDSAR